MYKKARIPQDERGDVKYWLWKEPEVHIWYCISPSEGAGVDFLTRFLHVRRLVLSPSLGILPNADTLIRMCLKIPNLFKIRTKIGSGNQHQPPHLESYNTEYALRAPPNPIFDIPT